MMLRRLWLLVYALALVVLTLAWVRSAWLMPLRNVAFDFSINYTGSRLISILGPDRPLYDRLTLALEAQPYNSYTALYTKLYLTYIQTPITAVISSPFGRLAFDDARFAFLAVSNLLFVAAVALLLWGLRPSRLLVFAAFLILGSYEAMFDSLRLGQVDALIVFCLSLSYFLLRRRQQALGGLPLALAALLKLSPVLVIGVFAVQRQWRVVAGALAGMALLLAGSIAIAGWDNHVTFMRDISPRLAKGSTFYDNISLAAAASRAWLGREYWYWEDEVPDWPLALRLGVYAVYAALVLGSYAFTRRDWEAGFMLAIAVALIVSPVTWSFYPTWLIPALLWIVRRAEDRRDWLTLAALLLLYPFLAIVPAHISEVDEDLYAIPIKTIALFAFALLVAAQTGRAGAPATTPPDQQPVGRASALS